MKRWLEPRIEGPPADPDNPYVAVDIKFINDLWVPDIYVYFLKQINVLTVFTKFAGKCFQTLACQYEVRFQDIHFPSSKTINSLDYPYNSFWNMVN